MKTYRQRHPEAYRFLQLTWLPKQNDRVTYEGERVTVQSYKAGHGIRVVGRKGYVPDNMVVYRPTQNDARALFEKLKDIYQYCTLIGHDRYLMGVICNGRQVHLKGRPIAILSQILNLRVVDSRINSSINRIFEDAYRGTKLSRQQRRKLARGVGSGPLHAEETSKH